jgi:hypothetical protein
MRTTAIFVSSLATAALLAFAWPALAEPEHRELGAHQHGHGSLDIAVEGNRLTISLDVPGADIVGFEHPPASPAETAAIETAKTRLGKPLDLFKVPAAAGCKLLSAKVEIGEHEEEPAKDAKPADKTEPAHSDVEAEYDVECTSPAALTAIEFDYFKTFSGAEALEVVLVTPKGQSKFDVTRAKPRLELGGLM